MSGSMTERKPGLQHHKNSVNVHMTQPGTARGDYGFDDM